MTVRRAQCDRCGAAGTLPDRAACCAGAGASARPAPPIQGPTFKAGVDLIRLDVTVVDKEGTPVDSLGSEDFEVKVDGKVRPVVTSRFLSLESRPLTGTPGSSLASTRDFSGNDPRRLAACS